MGIIRFETLIELHHDEIYRYLWRLLRSAGRSDSEMEAQDLAQEVFLRAYKAFGRLRPDSNHRAWLYKIATNRAYTALKRGNMHLDETWEQAGQYIADGNPSPEQQAVWGETLYAVRRGAATLPPKQQAAVVLRYGQELSYAEIAQALDCSEDSARANVYQGVRRLRQDLAQMKNEGRRTNDE
jgi:RNA polymerase sigma-70 factor (ECF subfamily)